MKKNMKIKIGFIVILLVAVIGLSLGFATFSTSLNIKSEASYIANPNNFKVDFSSSKIDVRTDKIVPITTPSNVEASEAIISNVTGAKSISGFRANFTAPGQKAVYTFYVANSGELEAFLKSIIFKNVNSFATSKVCEAKPGTNEALVNEACNDITLKVSIGSNLETSQSINNIFGHSLVKGAFEKVEVTIEYAANGKRTDGDFIVNFGDIALDYSSTDVN